MSIRERWNAFLVKAKRWLKWCGIGLAVVVVLALTVKIALSCAQQREDELKIAETLNTLEAVRPRGEIRFMCALHGWKTVWWNEPTRRRGSS